jgi:hypothetical protein
MGGSVGAGVGEGSRVVVGLIGVSVGFGCLVGGSSVEIRVDVGSSGEG